VRRQPEAVRFRGSGGLWEVRRMPWSGTSSGQGLNAVNSNCANRCRGAIEILHSVSRAVQSVRLFGPSVRNRIRIDAKFLNCFSCSAVIRDSCRCGKKEFCFVLGAVPFDGNDDRRTNQDAVLSGFGGHYGAFFDSERLRSLAGAITAPRLPTLRRSSPGVIG
jgi:hypothetical protein